MTLSLVGIFYPRPVPIRSAQRWSCCVERDAEVRKVCWPLMSSGISCSRWLRGRPRQSERTARVHVRASARTNGGKSAVSTNPGTSSKPKNPSVCGTQVRSCFRGPGPARTPSRVGRNRCPCAVHFSNGVRGARLASGRPRKRLLATRSARSLWGIRTKRRPASPGANDIRGDDACLLVARMA